MIPLPANVRVCLATGHTDMRKGFSSLGLIVQETLKRDPHCGHLFVFRGRRGDLIKVIWHDGRARASHILGTSAEEVDSITGPVVSAQALLAVVGWRALRNGRHDPPASSVLVRPAFGPESETDRADRPAGGAPPGHPRRGDHA